MLLSFIYSQINYTATKIYASVLVIEVHVTNMVYILYSYVLLTFISRTNAYVSKLRSVVRNIVVI